VPGFFLAFLYLVYIIGWALINPKVAPKLPPEQLIVPVPAPVQFLREHYSKNMLLATFKALFSPAKLMNAPADARLSFGKIFKNVLAALTPLFLIVLTMWGVWWYVIIHQQNERDAQNVPVATQVATASTSSAAEPIEEELLPLDATSSKIKSKVVEVDAPLVAIDAAAGDAPTADGPAAEAAAGPPENFELYFGLTCVLFGLLLIYYYLKFDEEQFEILKLLIESVMPLGVLTILVLAVILLGITTATESAAVGALGAFILAFQAGTLDFERTKQAVFLTAKTTSMVCWLFVGSALFSAVFTILGGQSIIEKWVLMLDLTPIQFMLLSQAIIFFLGWPLEWTEIIVIFVPIFLPLLAHFNIDPLLWGVLVFVNLQAAFLSPPVAMSAFYLKGVSPPGVTLNQIFAGMMPYMFIVIACMAFMYIWPGMTLWLPKFLYGG
jgi:TRAP-type mannitol/chloroaromatic compound transport system permease large subunit